MKIAVCLDDRNGMLFAGRRQSMDRLPQVTFGGTRADNLCARFFERVRHRLADAAVGTCDESRLS